MTPPEASEERICPERSDQALAAALQPIIEGALRKSASGEPQFWTEIFFPIIGPAIRKAVASSLSEMVRSLNQVLEYSLSPRMLVWRWEAFRSGKALAEIILLRTLVYRVEQVFLIHRETGLLLDHVTAPGVEAMEAGAVSAMLTAIQDFVQDSFGVVRGELLRTIHVGALNVWIEHGPHVLVAAVIRGTPPTTVRQVMRTAVEAIHAEHGLDLKNFSGRSDVFAGARARLDSCIVSEFQVRRSSRPWFAFTFVGVVLAAAALLAAWQYRESSRWRTYIERLRAQPGIAVIGADRSWSGGAVAVLRDPLAQNPLTLAQSAGVDPKFVDYQWTAFISLSPEIVESRARMTLHPPTTVTLRYDAPKLIASGRAQHDWIVRTRAAAPSIPGVDRLDMTNLIDSDLERARAEIEGESIAFATNSSVPAAPQLSRIRSLAMRIAELAQDAAAIELGVRAEVIGQADATGNEAGNESLSRERAARVARELEAGGVPAEMLTVRGIGSSPSISERQGPGRRATVHVAFFERKR
jgi:OOP family OmpA-OmpF porin